VFGVRSPRSLHFLLAMAAIAVAILQGVTGVAGLALYLAPALLLLALLITGRYIGEERLIAGYRKARPRRRPALAPSWPMGRERALTSLLSRAPQSRRGPPALRTAS
jgi:hypothetical protein